MNYFFSISSEPWRTRTRSASKSENSPAKDIQTHKPSGDIRRSMRKLFDDTNDAEITLKSPVKISPNEVDDDDTFKSPTKLRTRLTTTPRKKNIDTLNDTTNTNTRSSLISPMKELQDSPFKSPMKRPMRKLSEASPMKELPDSPFKSPMKRPMRKLSEASPMKELGSPFKSPMKRPMRRLPEASPMKELGSPFKSPMKRPMRKISGTITPKKKKSPSNDESKLQISPEIVNKLLRPQRKNLGSPIKSPLKDSRKQFHENFRENDFTKNDNISDNVVPKQSMMMSPAKKSSSPTKRALKISRSKKRLSTNPPPFAEKEPKNSDLEKIENNVDVETAVKSILSTPPQSSKQSKMLRSDSDKENLVMVTPESNRPSRHRKTVERMGIDDVKLLDTISPKVKFSSTASTSKLDEMLDEEELSKGFDDKSNDVLEVRSALPSLHDILSTPKSVSDLFDEMIGSGTTERGSATSAGKTTGSNVKENDDVNAIDELLTTPPVSKTYSKRRKSENQNNQQSDSVTRNLVVINLTPSRKKLSKEAVKESEIDHGE